MTIAGLRRRGWRAGLRERTKLPSTFENVDQVWRPISRGVDEFHCD